MSDVNLTQARQYYRATVVESEENSQRLLSLGVGAAAMVLLMTAPMLGPVLQVVWAGVAAVLAIGGIIGRRRAYEYLRDTLIEQQLQRFLPIDTELWERLGRMRELPAPLDSYVAHMLATYVDFRQQVSDEHEVEFGQVQLIEARERLLEVIDLAERTGAIRTVLETQGNRLSDEDQVRLRQRFSEQCAGLQEIAQIFDRSVANFAVARVLGDELGEISIDDIAERMTEIEEEFGEVKNSLGVDA